MKDAASIAVHELAALYRITIDDDLVPEIEAAIRAPLDGSSGHRVDPAKEERLLALPFISAHGEPGHPLVLDDCILRTQKLYDAEERIAHAIAMRLKEIDGNSIPDVEAEYAIELERFFPAHHASGEINEARRFAEIAIQSRFTILAGGPGTGKTYGVASLLALFIESALRKGAAPEELPKIALAAPTGKAAARMREAMVEALAPNPGRPNALGNHLSDEARDYLSALSAATLHRLLGITPRPSLRGPRFRPRVVDADIVVVDESSMIDLPLFMRLVEQVDPRARLLILGDPDQLPSVGVGSVLADLISFESTPSSKLGRTIARLTVSRRYPMDSSIRRLADAILAGDSIAALGSLSQRSDETLEKLPNHQAALRRHLRPTIVENFRSIRELLDTEGAPLTELFKRFDAHRTLALEHHGRGGVRSLNETITEWLVEAGLIELIQGTPSIEPILILRNSPEVERMNGDIGFIFRRDFPAARRGAYFLNELEGGVSRLSPHELPEWTRAFAMTVHKSQGSQFAHVSLVYPEKESRVASRELLFTAITRARERVSVYGEDSEIARSITVQTRRVSGLPRLLERKLAED